MCVLESSPTHLVIIFDQRSTGRKKFQVQLSEVAKLAAIVLYCSHYLWELELQLVTKLLNNWLYNCRTLCIQKFKSLVSNYLIRTISHVSSFLIRLEVNVVGDIVYTDLGKKIWNQENSSLEITVVLRESSGHDQYFKFQISFESLLCATPTHSNS